MARTLNVPTLPEPGVHPCGHRGGDEVDLPRRPGFAGRERGSRRAPATLVSVSRIFREGYLVELDVTAVVS